MTNPIASDITARAAAILRANDRGGYCVPTAGLYPFQWNWDSCLTALGWARIDLARAFAEMDSLFAGQWADGMLPHILFHRDDPGYFPGPAQWGCGAAIPSSGITQPPVAGLALKGLLAAVATDAQRRELAAKYLPGLHRWHRWWQAARDPDSTGLVAILHPWESGRDNSAEWDAALEAVIPLDEDLTAQRRDLDHVDADQRPSGLEYQRYMALVRLFRRHGYDPQWLWRETPFKMADVGINALLIHDMTCALEVMEQAGIMAEEAAWTRACIGEMRAGLERLYSPATGLYHSRDLLTDTLCDHPVSASYLPLLAGLPEDRAASLCSHAAGLLDRATYAMPSLDPADHRFEQQRYWRGPVWAIVNWLLALGFERAGSHGLAIAARLRHDTAQLIANAGFAEYFDPISGAGLGGGQFTWTAAMWLHWQLDDVLNQPMEPV